MIKKFYKQAKTFILRNKVSDFEYECVCTEIYRTNLSIMKICSGFTIFLFLLLGILNFFVPGFSLVRSLCCFVISAVLMLILLISRKVPPENLKRAVPLFYSFIWTVSIFTGFRGIYDNYSNFSVMFVVLEFAFPIIFIDKLKRIYGNLFLLALLNTVFTVLLKDPVIARTDVFYVWVFYFLSFVPSFYLTKIRVRELYLRQIIENQRDTDELTGLSNKAAFSREAKKYMNSTNSGILIIMDLDYFKEINDTYGHFTGDKILKKVAGCIQKVFRSTDAMGRFGGDEFVIFMVGATQLEIAKKRCEQLLDLLNSTPILDEETENSKTIQASIGFAAFESGDFDLLFKNADTALYDAKKAGKNRVCCFSETPV